LSAPWLSPERLDIARTVAAFALPEPGSPCPPFRFAICFWKPRARPTAPWCAVSERRYLMSNCARHHCLARDPILWGPGFVRSWRSRDQRGNEELRERFDKPIKPYPVDRRLDDTERAWSTSILRFCRRPHTVRFVNAGRPGFVDPYAAETALEFVSMPKRLPSDLQLLAKCRDRRAPLDRRNGFRLNAPAPRLTSGDRSPKHRQMPHVQVPASQRPVSRQSGD